MWTCTPEPLSAACLRYRPVHDGDDGSPLTWADPIRGWQADAACRSAFNRWLADAPFAAFRWECVPVTAAAAADRPFEFVLLDAPLLHPRADPRPFAEHFASPADPNVVAVPNLIGDAVMVIPCPAGPPAAYAHLATYVRQAPPAQRDAVWQAVGRAMHDRLGDRPTWLNTAGMAVQWLHLRLDSRPKYYGHAPYRTPPSP